MDEQKSAQPPQAPEMNRRVTMYPVQFIGMCLLALIPLLGLFGVFGDMQETAAANSASFSIQAEYPARSRHRVFETITVTITNESDNAYDAVTVGISEAYIASFAEVAFDLSVDRITPDAYEFELTDFQPGESRVVGVELRASDYGLRSGFIRVTAPNAEPVELPIGTFVFP
jgi:hypothetical protein